MSKSKVNFALLTILLFAGVFRSFGQTIPPATKEQEAKLIAVLKSDAPYKEKVAACRQLAVIGTKASVTPLAALLADQKLSHMARYGLEPIPDPAVDDALRDALGKLKGRLRVGVIGSIGVRRDSKAVNLLADMLQDTDAEVAQAAARALGTIGTSTAAVAMKRALADPAAPNRLALCEALFRCAENLAVQGHRHQAVAIYDQLRNLHAPHQVRAGALRGAILTRQTDGLPLLRQYLHSDDYILFSAAVQAAQELHGADVTQALTEELDQLPADNQILVIQSLGKRADPAALPALFATAKQATKPVRLVAIGALPQIAHTSAVPVLVELLAHADNEISQTAQEALAALPGQEADAAVTAMLSSTETSQRLTAIELIGRRRMTASIPQLLKAAGGADAQVRPAALRKVGELGTDAQLPALLDVLTHLKTSQDLDAAEQALSAVCAKADDPQSHTEKVTSMLAHAEPAKKSVLLHVLGAIGGTKALEAARAALNDYNAQVRAAAVLALCAWKTTDATPDLLALAKAWPDPSGKTAALRAYISLIRDDSLQLENKLAMCIEADALARRTEEKKLLLGVLGTVPAAKALSMAMSHLESPTTKDEAGFAVVAISEKIVEQKPMQVADALHKLMQATDNKEVTDRARVILDKAKKAAGQ